MTFEEAKKILEKEGFVPERFLGVLVEDVKVASWEKTEVGEAMKVVAENGYFPFMEKSKYEERKARLKKEYEKSTKAPGPGEEQSKEGDLKAAAKMFGAQAREIMRLKAENAELRETIDKMKEGNPALEESASKFNDALLDEQAKKIAELTKEKANLEDQITVLNACKKHNDKIDRKQIKCLGKEITRLNKIIHKKNLKIEELRKESSRHLREKMKMFGENFDLEQELKDKNAILSDVAEELRLSKIREKNLTESCQKYIKANEELKEKLANKVIDKIDTQALKSAESALAWKEKVIAEKDMALAYNEKEIADLKEKLKSIYKNRHIERVYKKKLVEKDEVIDNLHKELKAQKGLVNHISKKYDGAKINLNLRMKECEKLKEALDEANKHQQQAYRSCTDKNKEIRALKLQISALEKRGNGIDWKHNADAIKLYVNRASHERLWNPISQDICNEKELSFIINHGGKRVKYALHFDGTDIVYECSDPDKKSNDLMVGAEIAEEGGDNSGVIVLCGKDFIDAIKKMK